MARKTRRKKSAKGRIRRSEQVTPERLMERSFAYASPVIIGAGVSNVFDSLEDGAKTSPYVPSATAPQGWCVPVPHGQKTASRRAIFGQKRCLPAFRHRRHRASEAAWQTLCASTEISCHPFWFQSL
jgi:hypothetical protein